MPTIPQAAITSAAEAIEEYAGWSQSEKDGRRIHGLAMAKRLIRGTVTENDLAKAHRYYMRAVEIEEGDKTHRQPDQTFSIRLMGGQPLIDFIEANRSTFDHIDPVNDLFNQQPQDVAAALCLEAWRWEYGMSVDTAAKFTRDYAFATGKTFDMQKAFDTNADGVQRATVRYFIDNNPYLLLAEAAQRHKDDPEYIELVNQDVRYMTEAVDPTTAHILKDLPVTGKVMSSVWATFVAYFILAVEAPELARPINASMPLNRIPNPHETNKNHTPSQYNEPTFIFSEHLVPGGKRYTVPEEKFKDVPSTIYTLLVKAHRNMPITRADVAKKLRRLRDHMQTARMASGLFHIYLAQWNKGEWTDILSHIPVTSQVYAQFHQFVMSKVVPTLAPVDTASTPAPVTKPVSTPAPEAIKTDIAPNTPADVPLAQQAATVATQVKPVGTIGLFKQQEKIDMSSLAPFMAAFTPDAVNPYYTHALPDSAFSIAAVSAAINTALAEKSIAASTFKANKSVTQPVGTMYGNIGWEVGKVGNDYFVIYFPGRVYQGRRVLIAYSATPVFPVNKYSMDVFGAMVKLVQERCKAYASVPDVDVQILDSLKAEAYNTVDGFGVVENVTFGVVPDSQAAPNEPYPYCTVSNKAIRFSLPLALSMKSPAIHWDGDKTVVQMASTYTLLKSKVPVLLDVSNTGELAYVKSPLPPAPPPKKHPTAPPAIKANIGEHIMFAGVRAVYRVDSSLADDSVVRPGDVRLVYALADTVEELIPAVTPSMMTSATVIPNPKQGVLEPAQLFTLLGMKIAPGVTYSSLPHEPTPHVEILKCGSAWFTGTLPGDGESFDVLSVTSTVTSSFIVFAHQNSPLANAVSAKTKEDADWSKGLTPQEAALLSPLPANARAAFAAELKPIPGTSVCELDAWVDTDEDALEGNMYPSGVCLAKFKGGKRVLYVNYDTYTLGSGEPLHGVISYVDGESTTDSIFNAAALAYLRSLADTTATSKALKKLLKKYAYSIVDPCELKTWAIKVPNGDTVFGTLDGGTAPIVTQGATKIPSPTAPPDPANGVKVRPDKPALLYPKEGISADAISRIYHPGELKLVPFGKPSVGSNPAMFFKDAVSGHMLFIKAAKDDYANSRAEAEVSAYKIMGALTSAVIPVAAHKADTMKTNAGEPISTVLNERGKVSVQPMLPKDSQMLSAQLDELSQDDIQAILRQHVLDMYVGDFDGYHGNWMRMPGGALASIDKGMSFKMLSKNQRWVLDPFIPDLSGAAQPSLAVRILKAWATQPTFAIEPNAFVAMRQMAMDIEDKVTDELIDSSMAGYVDAVSTDFNMDKATAQARIVGGLKSRRDGYFKAWQSTMRDLAHRYGRAVSWPDRGQTQVLPKPESTADVSGFKFTQDSIEGIAETAGNGWAGGYVRADAGYIRNQVVVVKRVQKAQSGTDKPVYWTLIHFRFTPWAADKLTALLGSSAFQANTQTNVTLEKQGDDFYSRGGVLPFDNVWPLIEQAYQHINQHSLEDVKSSNGAAYVFKWKKYKIEGMYAASKTVGQWAEIVKHAKDKKEKYVTVASTTGGTTTIPTDSLLYLTRTYNSYLMFLMTVYADLQSNGQSSKYAFPQRQAALEYTTEGGAVEPMKQYSMWRFDPPDQMGQPAKKKNGAYVAHVTTGLTYSPAMTVLGRTKGGQEAQLAVQEKRTHVSNIDVKGEVFGPPDVSQINVVFNPEAEFHFCNYGNGNAGYNGWAWGFIKQEPSPESVALLMKLIGNLVGIKTDAPTAEDQDALYWLTQARGLQSGPANAFNIQSPQGSWKDVGLTTPAMKKAMAAYMAGDTAGAVRQAKNIVSEATSTAVPTLEAAAKETPRYVKEPGIGLVATRVGWTRDRIVKAFKSIMGKDVYIGHTLTEISGIYQNVKYIGPLSGKEGKTVDFMSVAIANNGALIANGYRRMCGKTVGSTATVDYPHGGDPFVFCGLVTDGALVNDETIGFDVSLLMRTDVGIVGPYTDGYGRVLKHSMVYSMEGLAHADWISDEPLKMISDSQICVEGTIDLKKYLSRAPIEHEMDRAVVIKHVKAAWGEQFKFCGLYTPEEVFAPK